ncbi:Histidine kinase [Flagellimonas maritima]|uniref:Histidine kinase n=1 Tax=Flagellimonas maritima TaxID=1383885 RepID=A0A2Z4LTV2_9FLAO|nr:histidine kinase [Allomuricauda aurantiaca]AWX45173.1 Histidine kinase [Allomuricauda aurantiaca]
MKKEPIYHISFWLAYLILWSAQDFVYFKDYFSVMLLNIFTVLPLLAIVYFNLYFLLPKFLFKKRYLVYVLFLCASIVAATYISSWNHQFYFTNIIHNVGIGNFFMSSEGKLAQLTEILVLMGLSMSIFLLRDRYTKEKVLEEAKKRQLEVELKLLKEQMNPHFLFNSLNSIYMMLDKHPGKGKEMLLRFSDILSHQLYESTEDSIALKKELENVKNYINIESIRHGSLATINVDCIDYSGKLNISPMILLPIIENAFKHSPSGSPYYITIFINLTTENRLILNVENSKVFKPVQKASGIGLANVKRRLELIYPKKYELYIDDIEKKFKITLKITLDD